MHRLAVAEPPDGTSTRLARSASTWPAATIALAIGESFGKWAVSKEELDVPFDGRARCDS